MENHYKAFTAIEQDQEARSEHKVCYTLYSAGSTLVFFNRESFLNEINEILDEAEHNSSTVGSEYTISTIEITLDQYNSLPDFEGF